MKQNDGKTQNMQNTASNALVTSYTSAQSGNIQGTQSATQSGNTQGMQSSQSAGNVQVVVGVFSGRDQAETAVQQLRQQGFGTEEINIVSKGSGGQNSGMKSGGSPAGSTSLTGADGSLAASGMGTSGFMQGGAGTPRMSGSAGASGGGQMTGATETYEDDITDGALTGGTLGGIGGLLVGAGALAIPGIGPIIAAGPIAAALSGAVAGGIAGGLIDWGIPAETSRRYEQNVAQGGILAVIRADSAKVNQAARILRDNGAKDVATHPAQST